MAADNVKNQGSRGKYNVFVHRGIETQRSGEANRSMTARRLEVYYGMRVPKGFLKPLVNTAAFSQVLQQGRSPAMTLIDPLQWSLDSSTPVFKLP